MSFSLLPRRLTPFFDVVGAVLIFGSWIASNALSQRAKGRTNTHQAIVDRIRHFRLVEDFVYRIRTLQSEVERTHELVETVASGAASSGNPIEAPPEEIVWTGMSQSRIRELNSFVGDVVRYAGRLSPPDEVTQSVTSAQEGVDKMSGAFRLAREEFDRLAAKPDGSAAPRSPDDSAAAKEFEGQVDGLWTQYDAAKENMLEVGDGLLRVAATEADAADALAKKSKQVSYILYIVGTLIVLAGRTQKALGAEAK